MKAIFSKLFIASSFLAIAVSAHADVLFDSYAGSAPGYDPINGLLIANVQYDGVLFNVSGTYQLTSIELPIGNLDNHTGVYDIGVYTKTATGPGTLLENFAVDITTTASISNHLLNSVTHPTLTTGTYMVVASTTDTNLRGGWSYNNGGLNGDQLFSQNQGATWTFYNATTLALQVNGSPVPEPASMAVLGVGALALLRRRNRK